MVDIAVYARLLTRTERRLLFVIPESMHGTMRGYNEFGCLCARCKLRAQDYRQERELARKRGEARKNRARSTPQSVTMIDSR